MVIASTNDPYAELDTMRGFAADWGSDIQLMGDAGHINAASGHGPWPEGLLMFGELMKRLRMITLLLLRHAKSALGHAGLADFDRPLVKRGQQEAAEMAELMTLKQYRPAKIVCSTSQRTRETLAALVPTLAGNANIVLDQRVYGAEAARLFDVIRETGDTATPLMVIGHNPGLEELAALLIDDKDSEAHSRLGVKFPPAGLAVIRFERERWSEVDAGTGTLVAFHTPGATATA